MRLSLLTFVATALYVHAAPKPQVIDFDALIDLYSTFSAGGAPLAADATATTVPFNPATASAAAATVTVATVGSTQPTVAPDADADDSDGSSRRKRTTAPVIAKRDGDCSTQNTISSYTLAPDSTVDDFESQYSGFLVNSTYTDGFNVYNVATDTDGSNAWLDLKAAANAPGYLGYTTLKTYDTQACMAACEKQSASAKVGNKCIAFNFYIERDPSLDPNADKCPSPTPIINVKCVFYSQSLTTASAVNSGQYRDSFLVAIASSNAFNKVVIPPTLPGFATPAVLPAAINAPLDAANGNIDTYMGTASFTTADPLNCAKACDAKTKYEQNYYKKDPNHPYKTCNYFNYYILQKNGVAAQQVCSFYSAPWDPKYAVNTGYTSGGVVYTIENSAAYTKSTVVRTDIPK